jgi:hypothetical protein
MAFIGFIIFMASLGIIGYGMDTIHHGLLIIWCGVLFGCLGYIMTED